MNPRPLIFILAFVATLVPAAQAEPVATATSPAAAALCLTAEQLLADLTRQAVERFQVQGELQLDLVRPWTAPAGVTGPVDVLVPGWPARLTSSLLLQVRFQSEGRVLAETALALKAQLMRDVWVARTPIERGTSFNSAELDTRRVDFLQQRDAVPADATEADLTYATSVSAGRLLTWRDLARRPLVRKGQIVDVAAIDGTLTITTRALAMENGTAGETIRLRNLESKKDFSALVVAEARAQVRF